MGDRARKFIGDVIGASVTDIVISLGKVLLGAGGLALLVQWLSQALAALRPHAIPLTCIAGAIGAMATAWALYRLGPAYARYPKPVFDFRVLERQAIYEYVAVDRMTYTRKLKLKALRSRLTSYVERYHWTGSGNLKVTLGEEAKSHNLLDTRGIWRYIEIGLKRVPRRGTPITVETRYDLEDQAGVAMPLLSVEIVEPTDRLVLEVRLPSAWGIREAVFEEGPTVGCLRGRAAEDGDELRFDSNGVLRHPIKRPRMLYRYSITWDMSHVPRGSAPGGLSAPLDERQ